ncbi:VapC toxin family PIN domain ribonuclease [bacterium]|nr:MAG: VapC toxin family PIN domain ribonuclease [bacterium]
MPEIFADTSGLLLYLDASQMGHQRVIDIARHHMTTGGTFVTTNYVLTELVALFTSRTRLSRTQICTAVDAIHQTPFFEVVHVTPELHANAFQLLRVRPDKDWSWVDAVSFLVMQNFGLTQALTTDHHFDQAGFDRLIK